MVPILAGADIPLPQLTRLLREGGNGRAAGNGCASAVQRCVSFYVGFSHLGNVA